MKRATLLTGTKVIELGDFFSAAYSSKILADLGADVIKIEPIDGDSARRYGPFPGDIPHPERSGLFTYLNGNKRSITVDIQSTTGKDVLMTLLQDTDVLVENLGQPYLAQIGLGADHLRTTCPDLIITSLSTFGCSDATVLPRSDDLVAFHASGYAQVVGGLVDDPNQTPPVKAAEYQADLLAGINGASASLVGLLSRARTGQAQWNDVSARDSLIPFVFAELARFMSAGVVPSRRRSDNPPNSVVVILPASDGEVAISPREEHLWQRWIGVMGNPPWSADPRFQDRESRAAHWDEIYRELAAWSSSRTKEEISRLAQEARVPSFPVNDITTMFASQQLQWREFFTEIDHHDIGGIRIPSAPYRLTRGEGDQTCHRPAPRLGEHTASILEQDLGYSRERIVRLRQLGVV